MSRPVAYGSPRDRQYRAALGLADWLQDLNLGLLVPPPEPLPAGIPDFPDDVRNRYTAGRHLAARASFVPQSPQYVLTEPGYNLVPGVVELPLLNWHAWRIAQAHRAIHASLQDQVSQPLVLLLDVAAPVDSGQIVYPDFLGREWKRNIARHIAGRAPPEVEGSPIWVLTTPEAAPLFEGQVPKGRPHPLPLRTHTESHLLNTLDGQGDKPNHQDDWPVPKGRPFPLDNRTFLESLVTTTLEGQDLLPFRQQDWQLPTKARPLPLENRTFTTNLSQTTLQPVSTDPPIAQRDWPNPRGRQYPLPLRTWTQGLLPVLETAGDEPFSLLDQPNPLRRRAPQQPEPAANLLTGSLSAQTPFTSGDWPNPVTKRRLPRDFSDGRLNTSLAGAEVQPFESGDWPLPPKGRPFPLENRSFSVNLSQTTLAPAPTDPAPNQDDWPNPRGRPYPLTLRTWTQPLLPVLELAGVQPFTPEEWPNPRRRPVPVQYEQAQNLLTGNLGAQAPFSQRDWPNPVLARPRGVETRTHIQTLPLELQNPFSLGEWPNPPRGRAYPLTNRTHTQGPRPQEAPFAIPEFPLPFRRVKRQQPEPPQRSLAIVTAPPAVFPPIDQASGGSGEDIGFGSSGGSDTRGAGTGEDMGYAGSGIDQGSGSGGGSIEH